MWTPQPLHLDFMHHHQETTATHRNKLRIPEYLSQTGWANAPGPWGILYQGRVRDGQSSGIEIGSPLAQIQGCKYDVIYSTFCVTLHSRRPEHKPRYTHKGLFPPLASPTTCAGHQLVCMFKATCWVAQEQAELVALGPPAESDTQLKKALRACFLNKDLGC